MSSKTQTFTASGTFTAPSTMLNGAVSVDVRGGAGKKGALGTRSATGGNGGRVTGSITLAPTGTLHVQIGYKPGGAAPSNAAGGGGGSAAVLSSATALVVEAGGGGGGAGGTIGANAAGGTGGGGGQPADPGANGREWAGSGTYVAATCGSGGAGANGATPGTGGAAATGGGTAGSAGTATSGGEGGLGASGTEGVAGGGGGGGYAGGGGGGGGNTGDDGTGGGGGGGSSYASAALGSPVYQTGYHSGTPAVIVTYVVADAPNVPTLVAPATGTHTVGSPLKFVYNPGANSGAIYKFAVRRKVGTTPFVYWTATGSAWVATLVELAADLLTFVAGTEWSYTFPSGAWTTGDTYSYSVATWEASFGLGGTFAPTASFVNATTSRVTITAPATPCTTATPTVAWTSSAEQTGYRVKLFLQATTEETGFTPAIGGGWLYDSGTVTSTAKTDTIPSSAGVTSGTTYVVYVKVTSGGTPSTWHSRTFAVSFAASPAPTLAANRTETATSGMPVVLLSAKVTPWTQTEFPALTVQIQGSDDTEVTWADIYGCSSLVVDTGTKQAHGTDYTCPNGQVRKYRARTHATHTGLAVTSAWTVATGRLLPNARWWIVDLTDPTTAVGLARGQSMTMVYGTTAHPSLVETRDAIVGIFNALGRTTTVKVSDVVHTPDFDLILDFIGQAAWDRFMVLWLANQVTGKTMLIKSDQPAEIYWSTFGPTRPATILRSADRVTNPVRQAVIHCYPATPVV